MMNPRIPAGIRLLGGTSSAANQQFVGGEIRQLALLKRAGFLLQCSVSGRFGSRSQRVFLDQRAGCTHARSSDRSGKPYCEGAWSRSPPVPDVLGVKRMYVAPAARRTGLGRRLVATLEARALGARRLVLETGIWQQAAIALYRATGFHPIPALRRIPGLSRHQRLPDHAQAGAAAGSGQVARAGERVFCFRADRQIRECLLDLVRPGDVVFPARPGATRNARNDRRGQSARGADCPEF
jgi:GNAT superfamily N-acetyltransferase